MPSTPLEFTPEITEDYYKKMARPIEERGASNVGLARSEALSRGLTGDPFESTGVGAARAGTSKELSDLYSGINFDVAGLARGERLTKEGQTFQAGESEKNRAFEERMARLGYGNQRDMLAQQNRYAQQQLPWQIGGQALGIGAGYGLAKLV